MDTPPDDDRHWLDAVAGRPTLPGADLATVKEGAVVRESILASRRTAPKLDVEAGARKLVKRLHAEKLFAAPRFGWKVPALAAGVALVLAFGFALRTPPQTAPKAPDVPVLAGDPGEAQVLAVQNPGEIADEIREMMSKAGLSPQTSETGSTTRFEAPWPRSPSENQLEFLRLYGLSQPAGPRLTVEVRRKPQS